MGESAEDLELEELGSVDTLVDVVGFCIGAFVRLRSTKCMRLRWYWASRHHQGVQAGIPIQRQPRWS